MDDAKVNAIVASYADKFSRLILAEEAAAIAGIPVKTIHDWSSRGLFDGFKFKMGRRIRLDRDAFVRFLVAQSGGSAKP